MNSDSTPKSGILPAAAGLMNGNPAFMGAMYKKKKEELNFTVVNSLGVVVGHAKACRNGFLVMEGFPDMEVPEEKRAKMLEIMNKANAKMLRGKFDINRNGQICFENFITFYDGQRMNMDDFFEELNLGIRCLFKHRPEMMEAIEPEEGEFIIKE